MIRNQLFSNLATLWACARARPGERGRCGSLQKAQIEKDRQWASETPSTASTRGACQILSAFHRGFHKFVGLYYITLILSSFADVSRHYITESAYQRAPRLALSLLLGSTARRAYLTARRTCRRANRQRCSRRGTGPSHCALPRAASRRDRPRACRAWPTLAAPPGRRG